MRRTCALYLSSCSLREAKLAVHSPIHLSTFSSKRLVPSSLASLRTRLYTSLARHTPSYRVVLQTARKAPDETLTGSESRPHIRPFAADGVHDAATQRTDRRSRRLYKRRRSSPSKALEIAVNQKKLWWAAPYQRTRHLDLSYVNMRKATKERLLQEYKMESLPRHPRSQTSEPSLQSILAVYVCAIGENTSPSSSLDPQSVELSAAERHLLQKTGFTIEDVVIWNAILTTEDALSASETMFAHAKDGNRKPLPMFLILFFLRRIQMGPQAFRNVLMYLWTQARPGSMNESTLFLLVVRLVRIARTALPEAFMSIVRLFTHVTKLPSGWVADRDTGDRRSASRVVMQYNKLLGLISNPSPIQPYQTTRWQQAAQFDLLRYMAEQRPPIPVNREGYHAITRVQLASAKTDQERDWARLKAPTWPPWKEDKMGFDSDKGPEYGVSRALAAIHHAHDAGYGSSRWEKVASILAGWDTDYTPTIQTRAWLLHKRVDPLLRQYSDQDRQQIWAARIRATRTVQESWALFLTYEDEVGVPERPVYFQMLAKLGAEGVRLETINELPKGSQVADVRQLEGGDAREVLPIPSSPREGVYVRTSPPKMDDLAEQMHRQGIKPSGHLLAMLLSYARSLEHSIKYLQWADTLGDSPLQSLLSTRGVLDERIYEVPTYLFAAFLKTLCTKKIETPDDLRSRCGIKDPILHALWLLRVRAPQYPPAWHVLLNALGSTRKSNLTSSANNLGHEIERLSIAILVRRHMKETGLDMDLQTFHELSKSMQRAIIAAVKIQHTHGSKEFRSLSHALKFPGPLPFANAPELIERGPSFTRKLFYGLFGTQDARKTGLTTSVKTEMPQLLAQPQGMVLHSYLRVLGLVRNYHHMLEVVRWMSEHRCEIVAATKSVRNGKSTLRKALIALRVFCERSWVGPEHRTAGSGGVPRAAPSLTQTKIRELIEANKAEWGGWPTDDEVKAYCCGPMFEELKQAGIH